MRGQGVVPPLSDETRRGFEVSKSKILHDP